MRVTIVQQDIELGQFAQNMEKAERAIRTQEGSDLYVLPEMFSTGFVASPKELPEKIEEETLAWMKRMANEMNAAIAAGLCVKESNKIYNRFCFVEPEGKVTCYDKRHLFGAEKTDYTRGEGRTIVEYKGVRFLLQVCYDLRFPVFSRNRKDYDAIIYTANWPASRINAWRTLLRARAIENQCYVIGVNRVGEDGMNVFPGCSAIIHPYGNADVECMQGMEQTATWNLDIDRLKKFRQEFDVLDDADEFRII